MLSNADASRIADNFAIKYGFYPSTIVMKGLLDIFDEYWKVNTNYQCVNQIAFSKDFTIIYVNQGHPLNKFEWAYTYSMYDNKWIEIRR